MVTRVTHTETVYLGEEIITGKRFDERGRLVDPIARINLPNRRLTIYPKKDTGAVILQVKIKYQEATEKEDTPHFELEILGEDEALVGRYSKSPSEDVFAKCTEYEETIDALIDLGALSESRDSLRAILRCWLEESSWTPRGDQGDRTVFAENYVDLTFVIPEINEPGPNPPSIAFNVIGRALYVDETPKDYEQQYTDRNYKINALVINNTNNILSEGALTVYENDMSLQNLEEFSWTQEIPAGESASFIKNDIVKSWTPWYELLPNNRLRVIESQRTFIYKLSYSLRDECGFEYHGVVSTPLRKLKIVVSIPPDKLDAVQVYNWTFDVEAGMDVVASIGALALDIGITVLTLGLNKAIIALTGATTGLSTYALFEWIDAKTVEESAAKLRGSMLEWIADPPNLDKNYRKLAIPKPVKVKTPTSKSKCKMRFYNIACLNLSTATNLKVLCTTMSRAWTAKVKQDIATFRKQNNALKKYKRKLVKDFVSLANNYKNLALEWKKTKIKLRPTDIIWLQQQTKKKEFFDAVRKSLKRKGIADAGIDNLKRKILKIDLSNLDPAKNYIKFSKSLLKFSKSLAKVKVRYD